jgi:hypothetical protein
MVMGKECGRMDTSPSAFQLSTYAVQDFDVIGALSRTTHFGTTLMNTCIVDQKTPPWYLLVVMESSWVAYLAIQGAFAREESRRRKVAIIASM